MPFSTDKKKILTGFIPLQDSKRKRCNCRMAPTRARSTLVTGFTIMEIVIAVGIFSVVIVTIAASFIKLSSTQRNIRNKEDVLNELRFAIDLMGQEINSGSAFTIPPTAECYPASTCTGNSCDTMCFASRVRPDIPLRRMEYKLDVPTGTIVRAEKKTFGLCAILPLDPKCYQPITSARVYIDKLAFFVNNKGLNLQPLVTVAVEGTIIGDKPHM